MKKRLKLLILIFFIIFILYNSLEIMENIRLSFKICINNLFPSLIPFMLLSNILINYNFLDDLNDILGEIMNNIFKVSKYTSFAFIMSIISGTPNNAKCLKDLKDNNLIDDNDLQKCLNFCHFTNPIFILGTIGAIYLKDKKLGLIILISHYISSIIVGLFNNKNYNTNIIKSNNKKEKNNFINILNKSIYSTINTLLLILGIITTCIIITCLLNKIFNLNNNTKFIYGLIEITQGLNFLASSNLNFKIKSIIASFLISFGGICIHLQVFSIIDNKKIRYLPYLISRIISSIIASFLTYTLINLLY